METDLIHLVHISSGIRLLLTHLQMDSLINVDVGRVKENPVAHRKTKRT